MDETILKVVLAGLLHDIGKFMQRAELEKLYPEIIENYGGFCPLDDRNSYGYRHAAHTAYFIEKFVPENLLDKTELYNGARHHKNPPGDIYKEADCLSAGMDRHPPETDEGNFKDVRLHSIFEEIELQYAIQDKDKRIQSRWRYNLAPLSSSDSRFCYPYLMNGNQSQHFDNEMTYGNLWNAFEKEVEEIQGIADPGTYFNEIMWLLEKYTACIPSATNVLPDISLYDHAKTTAAIASVLYLYDRESYGQKEPFILYTGDISGIQDYIFRISSIQGIGSIAKRLRGRSFYIMMLGEVIARHIIREAGLTEANINFCGGGNFELLLPNTDKVDQLLMDTEESLNIWLLQEHQGSLGYIDAMEKMSAETLRKNYGEVRDRLSDKLGIKKLAKNRAHLNEESFWINKAKQKDRITVCPSCNLKLISTDENICPMCKLDKDVGSFLPKAGYIVFSEGGGQPPDSFLSMTFGRSGRFGRVTLLGKDTSPEDLNGISATVYTFHKDLTGVKSRYPLAQTTPVALESINLDTEEDEEGNKEVHINQTLSFSSLADMAQGDKRIGVLEMDVDHMGTIFSVGMESSKTESPRNTSLRSISRIAVISRQLTAFFTDMVDQACTKVFQDWQHDNENNWPNKLNISNIFYLIFSGGDDLVVVGPWDRIIDLAREIRESFKAFTCYNPNITLSAGVYICKPKFPISVAVEKANEALDQAKSKGRNRITVMGETAVWARENKDSLIYRSELRSLYPGSIFERTEILSDHLYIKNSGADKRDVSALSFEELYEFSLELERLYKEGVVSRGFIRRLLDAKEVFFREEYNPDTRRVEEEHNFMCFPHLVYNITRNVKKDAQDILKSRLITTGETPQYVRQAYFPCKRVLMITKNQ